MFVSFYVMTCVGCVLGARCGRVATTCQIFSKQNKNKNKTVQTFKQPFFCLSQIWPDLHVQIVRVMHTFHTTCMHTLYTYCRAFQLVYLQLRADSIVQNNWYSELYHISVWMARIVSPAFLVIALWIFFWWTTHYQELSLVSRSRSRVTVTVTVTVIVTGYLF
jgi:hypothetical protein